jgi:hypothetical protein
MAKTRARVRGGRSNRLGAIEVLNPQLHRSWWVQLLLALWRWAFEITLFVLLVITWFRLRAHMPNYAVAAVLVVPFAIGCNFPHVRRLLIGWCWVLIVRHRFRTALVQTGVRNRSGKLPWIVAWRPTPVGERVTLLMVAGMSATDVENAAEAIAAACWARQVRVDKNRRSAAFVRVDVIRRDPLESPKPIGSRLMRAFGKTVDPVPVDITTAPAPFRTATYGPVVTAASSAPDASTTPKKTPRVVDDDGPDPDGGLSDYV